MVVLAPHALGSGASHLADRHHDGSSLAGKDGGFMDFDLNTPLNVKLALVFLGGAILLAGAIVTWIYAQFLKPPVDDLQKRLREYELANAMQSGKDLPDRLQRVEERVRQLELEVAYLKTSESQRQLQQTRALEELTALIEKLKEDMRRGDIDSRVDSAEALVSSLRVAVTLANLQSQEARDQKNAELREAEAALAKLEAEQLRARGDA